MSRTRAPRLRSLLHYSPHRRDVVGVAGVSSARSPITNARTAPCDREPRSIDGGAFEGVEVSGKVPTHFILREGRAGNVFDPSINSSNHAASLGTGRTPTQTGDDRVTP